MGGQVCSSQKIEDYDPLSLKYAVDQKQFGIQYLPGQKNIICNNKQVQKILDTYCDNLKSQKCLYKDKSMKTDSIILKSSINQIKCRYQRPYKFLNDVRKNEAYKIIDQKDYQPCSIEVKDQIMNYFGVFLCFLADKPSLIKKIICTSQNPYGLQCIQAYREGKTLNFLIDDYILCRQDIQQKNIVLPIFSQPIKNIYMWPCLIQKAWFKIKGNSAKRIEQNQPQQVFQTFLPLPIKKHYLNDGLNSNSKQILSEIFNKQQVLFKNNSYILRSKKNPEHDIGLSGSKYFYLLDIFNHDGKKIFYIHNPFWGMVFRGTHDQKSNKFKNYLQKWNLLQASSGNFLLDEDEFTQQISQVLEVHYIPGNKITSYCFQFQNQQQFFLGLDIKYKGMFNLSIVQDIIGNFQKNKVYYPLIYHVVRLNDMKLLGGFQNKGGCFGSKNTYILDNFNEDSVSGKYLIRLKKKQYQSIHNIQTYFLAYHPENVKIQLPKQNQLNQKWKQFLRKQGQKQLSYNQSKTQKSSQIAHVVCWIGDIVFIYIQNKSKKLQVSIQTNFPELMNLQCISHPQIVRSNQWNSYKFKDYFIIVFEKIILTSETHIRQYHLQSY